MTLIAGSCSHVAISDLISTFDPTNCLAQFRVTMRIWHPEYFSIPQAVDDSICDSNRVYMDDADEFFPGSKIFSFFCGRQLNLLYVAHFQNIQLPFEEKKKQTQW